MIWTTCAFYIHISFVTIACYIGMAISFGKRMRNMGGVFQHEGRRRMTVDANGRSDGQRK